jgi:L,D-transpeptidase catalytic domain/Putative peptidoglycan binding domain
MVVKKGKHAKRVLAGGRLPVVLLLIAVATVTIGGTAFAALHYDESNARRILPGVSVAGVDVGGMTRSDAMKAIRSKSRATLGSHLRIHAGGRSWDVTPADLGLHANVSGAVSRALAINQSVGFFSRVYHRALDRSVGARVKLPFASRRAKISTFVDGISRRVEQPARDAAVALSDDGSHVVFQHAHDGRAIDAGKATLAIRDALRRRQSSVDLPMTSVQPKVSDAKVGYTIAVSRPTNELLLYKGFKVVKTFPVATAMPSFTTPPGTWTIVNKVANPTWVNPAPSGWGSGEPASIPPGPGNPLGTRALYLNAPGIRIHGTYDSASVGTYASHGCIRMQIADSEELYSIVPVGTTVLII